ncbi:MAG: hypothetical protein AAF487_07960 [Bacteroidota bacterium]
MKENFRKEQELQETAPHSGHRDRFLKKLEGSDAEPKTSRSKYFTWAIAASIAALFALFMVFNSTDGKDELIEVNSLNTSPKLELAAQSDHLEAIYAAHVSPQILKIKRHLPELETQIRLLEILESEYAKLKELHLSSGGNSLVTQEMIRNHELRLSLMEQVLKHIELDKNEKSKRHEIENI